MKTGCGCAIAVLLVNAIVGTWAFAYCLSDIWGKHVPLILDLLCGLLLGEITVPLGIVLWLLHFAGIHGPWL